jgi:uncharacterized protein YjbI with pentapeptide repeats
MVNIIMYFMRARSASPLSGLIFSVLLLLLLSAGCAPVNVDQITRQKDAAQLASAEILALVEKNTLFVRSFNEDIYYYFDSSGTLAGLDIYNNKDTGRWDANNEDELCVKMRKWWYGDLRCFQVYAADEKYYLVNHAGVIEFRAEQFAGDHKNQFQAADGKGRKGSRRSARQAEADPGQAAFSTAEQTAGPVAEPLQVAPISDQELKTTVKWMARDCPGCNLANADLRHADLAEARLQRANLAGADISMANLRRADLQGANLTGADLSQANMPGADLRNAVLINAVLKGANLIRADLTGASTAGANFDGALLEGTIGLRIED